MSTSQSLQFTGGYQAGEIVYIPYGQGLAAVYQCIRATAESPLQADAWDANTIYQIGQPVSFPGSMVFTLGPSGSLLGSGSDPLGNQLYWSVANVNVGNEPDLTNTGNVWPVWNATTAYTAVGTVVSDVDQQLYSLIQPSTGTGGIAGWQPSMDYAVTYWSPMGMFINMWAPFQGTCVNPNWQQLNVALVPISIVWPFGAGPVEDTSSMNVYHLPSNWIREAPEEPKAGITPWLGGPTNIVQKDWVFEGDYIITRSAGGLLMRFVADINDVTKFDPMFAEAFSLQLAIETGGTIDNDQGNGPVSKYRMTISAARQVNAIEVGPVTPPDDQFITVRY